MGRDLKTITVALSGDGFERELQVEEFIPRDPAAYQDEAGWACTDADSEREYFVSEGGNVWQQPENVEVGIAPEIRRQSEQMEKEISRWMES